MLGSVISIHFVFYVFELQQESEEDTESGRGLSKFLPPIVGNHLTFPALQFLNDKTRESVKLEFLFQVRICECYNRMLLKI